MKDKGITYGKNRKSDNEKYVYGVYSYPLN